MTQALSCALSFALGFAAVLLLAGIGCCVMWAVESRRPRGRHAARRSTPRPVPPAARSTQDDEPTIDERFWTVAEQMPDVQAEFCLLMSNVDIEEESP